MLSTQSSYGLEQLQAGAERQTELFEVLVGELRQDRGIDLVVAEHWLVALQTEALEPSRDVHLAFPAPDVSAPLVNRSSTMSSESRHAKSRPARSTTPTNRALSGSGRI
jgi:hypothetical protein